MYFADSNLKRFGLVDEVAPIGRVTRSRSAPPPGLGRTQIQTVLMKYAQASGGGFGEALLVFNPFIAGENPGVANFNVAEKPGHVFFKFISIFLVAPDGEVPQRNDEDEANIEDKNIKTNA